MRQVRGVRRRHPHRRAVRRVHAAGAAPGGADRTLGRDGHHAAPRSVRGVDAAPRPNGQAGGSGGGADLVRSDVSHCQTRRLGVDEMKPSAISRRPSVSGLVGVLLCAAAGPVTGQMSLSIYKDGRVVVRQSLPQPLPKGRSTLSLKLDGLDPATLFSPDIAVAVLSATLRPSCVPANALLYAIGSNRSLVSATVSTYH